MDDKIKGFKGKDYKDLDNSSKERLKAVLLKVHKSGNSFSELREMDDKEFAIELGIKNTKRNISSYRRLIRQAYGSKERRENTRDKSLVYYKSIGFRGKRLEKTKVELNFTVGNTFHAVSEILQKEKYFNIKNKDIRIRTANKRTKELLLIPKSERYKLEQKEKDVLNFWSQ